jgi:hypothetical protein
MTTDFNEPVLGTVYGPIIPPRSSRQTSIFSFCLPLHPLCPVRNSCRAAGRNQSRIRRSVGAPRRPGTVSVADCPGEDRRGAMSEARGAADRSGSPWLLRGSTARPGRGRALGPAGARRNSPPLEPRSARLFQSKGGEFRLAPISGPETALPLPHGEPNARAAQRRPGAGHRARPGPRRTPPLL